MKIGGYSQIMLYPENKEKAREELEIKKNHKWLFLTFDDGMIKGIKEYMKICFDNEGKTLIIDGDKEVEAFFGKDELGWRRFVNATGMDGGTVYIQDLKIPVKEGKDESVSFLYTGMDLDDVEKHYKKFLDKVRDLIKENKKR